MSYVHLSRTNTTTGCLWSVMLVQALQVLECEAVSADSHCERFASRVFSGISGERGDGVFQEGGERDEREAMSEIVDSSALVRETEDR